MPLTDEQTAEFQALMLDLDRRDHQRRVSQYDDWETEQGRRAAAFEALSDGEYDAWLDAQNAEHEARCDAGMYRPAA